MNRQQAIASEALEQLVTDFRTEAERWEDPTRFWILNEADALEGIVTSLLDDVVSDVYAFGRLDEGRDHLATFILRRCVTDDEARSFIKRMIGITS